VKHTRSKWSAQIRENADIRPPKKAIKTGISAVGNSKKQETKVVLCAFFLATVGERRVNMVSSA
jgi:hypothetical protein